MSSYAGPVVDVDVHHRPQHDTEIVAYLSERWREYVRGDGRSALPLLPPDSGVGDLTPGGGDDRFGVDGARPGSDYATLREQLLDPCNVYRAILTHNVGQFGAHHNPYYAAAVCSAANDWTIEEWLPRDERLTMLIATPFGQPEEAAKEIRRVGGHPRVVGVLMSGNVLGRPLGDPIYEPIYEAASEMGLNLSVHINSSDRPSPIILSAGGAKDWTEYLSQASQQAMHYISSLIVHGTFERHPNLHIIIKEFGVAWLPALMWRLDDSYELLRRESPWVKRRPSEVIHDHVRLSTQPIEESPDSRGALAELLVTVDGVEDMLCFSSDYPHATMDEPGFVARQLPRAWHRKLFCDNACAAYGWTPPPADWRVPSPLEAGSR
jgi:predicted TIM-barrel fold metal-dependent hydrolase